jgi:hypothetical protein
MEKTEPETKEDVLKALKSNLEKSLKFKDISTKAAKASAMNIEQVTRYKKLRLRFWITVGVLLLIFILYVIFFCLVEYSDVRSFINQYGQQAGVPLSGFQMALVLKYPILTGLFQIENKSFPVAVLLSIRTQTFATVFNQNPVCNLQSLYSYSLYGSANVTGDSDMVTSALSLICNSYGKEGSCSGVTSSIAVCNGPCNYTSGSGNLASTAAGLQMATSMGNLGSLGGPPGMLIGSIVGFIGGFCLNKYAKSDNSSANCIS